MLSSKGASASTGVIGSLDVDGMNSPLLASSGLTHLSDTLIDNIILPVLV